MLTLMDRWCRTKVAVRRSGDRHSEAFEVGGGSPQKSGIITEQAKAAVASAAQDAPDYSGLVAVIDGRAPDAAGASDGLCGSADRALPRLQSKPRPPFRLLLIVATTALKSETGPAQRSKGRGVRPSVSVGVRKSNVAPGTVGSGFTHCPILPAETYLSLVIPSPSTTSALVEAITGEPLERAA